MRPVVRYSLLLAALAGCAQPSAQAPSPGAIAGSPGKVVRGASPAPSPTPTPGPAGLIVPLYTKPDHEGWARLVAIRARHPKLPVIGIVNPNNGASWDVSPAYTQGIAGLKAAGVTVVGYVFTGYGERAASSVKREVARWHDLYPQVDGIFFDEMATKPATVPYYQQAADDARAIGYRLLVGNFGTHAAAIQRDTVDVAVTYEADGWPDEAKLGEPAREREAMLAHGVETFEPAVARRFATRFRWLYATEDTKPNPWNSLSRHCEALADALDP